MVIYDANKIIEEIQKVWYDEGNNKQCDTGSPNDSNNSNEQRLQEHDNNIRYIVCNRNNTCCNNNEK